MRSPSRILAVVLLVLIIVVMIFKDPAISAIEVSLTPEGYLPVVRNDATPTPAPTSTNTPTPQPSLPPPTLSIPTPTSTATPASTPRPTDVPPRTDPPNVPRFPQSWLIYYDYIATCHNYDYWVAYRTSPSHSTTEISDWYLDTMPNHGWIFDHIVVHDDGFTQYWDEAGGGPLPLYLLVAIYETPFDQRPVGGCFGSIYYPPSVGNERQIEIVIDESWK